MSTELLITLIVACIAVISTVVTIITSIRSGSLKQFILEKMEEAEHLELTGALKLDYVIQAVKDKYKLLALIINIKKIVEILISFSKQVNYKK